MGWAKVVLVLVALQSITTLLPHRAAAGDLLSPLLQPVFNEICNHSVECGKGTCEVSSDILGFVCKCNPGWTQFHIGDDLRFLPCIVPNCSINYSCYNDSTAATAPPLQHPTNLSILDPCLYSYCGGGGTCVNTSTYKYRCECKEGFSNLLNQTTFPCYRDCSLGADCANLGITLSNSSSSSPPNLSDSGSSAGGDTLAPNSLLWMIMVVIPLIIARDR